jgi:hypothetical protein
VADKHVGQEFMTLDERLDDMISRHPEHRASIEAARRPAHALVAELADAVELDVANLVARLRRAWEASQA